ncbi:MAG: hypothetical protein JWN03_8005 [Nocardia sp.]|nr:hypothetical protein [Nocardia sp.]
MLARVGGEVGVVPINILERIEVLVQRSFRQQQQRAEVADHCTSPTTVALIRLTSVAL